MAEAERKQVYLFTLLHRDLAIRLKNGTVIKSFIPDTIERVPKGGIDYYALLNSETGEYYFADDLDAIEYNDTPEEGKIRHKKYSDKLAQKEGFENWDKMMEFIESKKEA